MKIWLIKDGENLPVEPSPRKMRTWMLSEELLRRGHSLTWWAGTFSHQQKKLLFHGNTEIDIEPKFKLHLLHAGSYDKNFSIRRYIHHKILARRFYEAANNANPPDLIVSAFPIIDMAYEAAGYAHRNRVPIIIDIRDLWPDIIIDLFPNMLRPLAKLALHRDAMKTADLLKKADSLVAVSSGCLQWGLKKIGRPKENNDRVFYIGYPAKKINDNHQSDIIEKFIASHQDKIIFTFVGIFGITYELLLLCDVAERLWLEGRNQIHFALAGKGELAKTISRRAAKLPNVSLLGWLNENEIHRLLSHSHVGLIPAKGGLSGFDAMPNKPFEYFSTGLPIISSLEGEMEELIRKDNVGLSYKPGDIKALHGHIWEISRDESLRRQLGTNAAQLFNSKFKAEIIYGEYADHIERLFVQKHKNHD
jgi:glycosyltransferase involved in cell wall biosynthesis